MKGIDVTGLRREQTKKTIEATTPGCFEVFVHNNMEAVMKMKSGQLDYYIGVCNTGAGVVLSTIVTVIDCSRNHAIAKPGTKARNGHIAKMTTEGKVASGFSVEYVEHMIPMLTDHLK